MGKTNQIRQLASFTKSIVEIKERNVLDAWSDLPGTVGYL